MIEDADDEDDIIIVEKEYILLFRPKTHYTNLKQN
jgi:hypothetical protein